MTDTSTDDTPAADAQVTDDDKGVHAADTLDAQVDTDDDDADDDTDETDDGKHSGNREAAKYRRRLRETEAQLATAATQVENLQRQQVETMVAAERHPIKVEALWMTTALADVLADDGTVDAEKVAAAIEATREALGIAGPPMGNYIPGLGNRPQAMPTLSAVDEMVRQIAGRK